MKRVFALLMVIVSSLLLNSCSKPDTGCEPVPVATERAQLIAYCNANGITYTEHPTGLLYEIITPGAGATPSISSTVSVVYTGKRFDNTIFDATANPYTNILGNLIDGWKIGLPLIKKGGRIKLVIPSALAYSCGGAGASIAPNSPLFFDITLADVK
jgi:FKBP-type peptidyl-prolyl cis-trans isomerase FkpA